MVDTADFAAGQTQRLGLNPDVAGVNDALQQVRPGDSNPYVGSPQPAPVDAQAPDTNTGQLTLNPPDTAPQGQLTLSQVQPPPLDQAQLTAAKADFAMGFRSPGQDTIQNNIMSGDESQMRQNYAQQVDSDKAQTVSQLLQRMAQSPASPQQSELVKGLFSIDPTNPDTVWEHDYAHKYVGVALQVNPDSYVFADSIRNPLYSDQLLYQTNATADIITKQQLINKLQQENEQAHANRGWGAAAGDLALGMVPLANAIRMHDWSGSILPGGNLGERVNALWGETNDGFLAKTKEAMSSMTLDEKDTFLDALKSYPTSSAVFNNLTAAADVATIADLGLIGKKMLRSVYGPASKEAVEGLRSVALSAQLSERADATTAAKVDVQDALTTVGALDKAAAAGATQRIQAGVSKDVGLENAWSKADPLGESWPLRKDLPSLSNPDAITTGNPSAMSREASTRLTNKLTGSAQDLVSAISETQRVQRITVPLESARVDAALDSIKKDYPQLSDGILDIGPQGLDSYNIYHPSSTNITSVGLMLGKKEIKAESPSLIVARKLPSGEIKYGKPGETHGDLLTERERVNTTSVDDKQMGFAEPGGSFMSRKQAQEYLEKNTSFVGPKDDYGLESLLYKEHLQENASVKLGSNKAQLFNSPQQAETWARDVYALPDVDPTSGLPIWRVQQHGTGHYIEVIRPINEMAEGDRALMLKTGNTDPQSVFNLLLGKIRSTEDLVSPYNSANRKIATYGPNQLKAVAQKMSKEIGSIGTKRVNEISDVLRVLLSKEDPITGKPGYYPQTIADWEQEFKAVHNKLPSDKQTQAYFSTLQLNDADYMLRNLGIYTDKARHGAQDYRFRHTQPGEGGSTKTDFYTAVDRADLPWTVPDDAGVLVSQTGIHEGGGNQKYYRMNDIKNDHSPDIAQLRRDIKEGRLKVLQTYDPLGDAKSTLADASGLPHPVHFVVTDTAEAKRLDWKQIDYQPGHAFYQSEWFIKQPKISKGVNGRLTYWGDITIRAAGTEAQAKKFAGHYDNARKLLLQGDLHGAEAYVRQHLPEDWRDFRKLFSGNGPDGGLDLEHPIVHTYTGRDTLESSDVLSKSPEYANLHENQGSAFNLAQQMNKKQIAEKGAILPQINEQNRLVTLQPSKLLDPYPAMSRALSQAIRSRYMDDYKISSAMTWVERYAPVLKENINKLRRNPLYYLYHPPFREGAAGSNIELLNAARLSQQAVKSFLGTSDEVQRSVGWLKQRLLNTVYDKVNPRAATFVDDHMLPSISDPAAYMRNIAFHANIGLFNPVHLLMQSQSLLHVIAVAGPKAGGPGHVGAWLSRFLLSRQDDEATIQSFDRLAARLGPGVFGGGWKEGEFGEMFRSMRDSGFSRVMGETVLRDDVKSPNIWSGTGITKAWHTFLDKGTVFYTEAERMVRMAAYATAYKEWRLANPLEELERRAQMSILQRSDLLAVNMSAASASGIQRGAASIVTQFTAFSMRLAEQMLGKRLTIAEKARAFGMYATMYGIPTTLAGMSGIWPFYEDMRTSAMNNGTDMSTWDYKAFHEGILSMMVSGVTGQDYNFADRYGPFATSIFKDAWYSDKTMNEVLMGPSGSMIYNLYKSSYPFISWLGQNIHDGPTAPNPQPQDILDILKNASSIGNLSKGLVAFNLGKLFSKNDTLVDGATSKMDAVMAGFFGLTNTKDSDTYLKKEWIEHNKANLAVAEQDAIKEMKRTIEAAGNGDKETAELHRMRFQVIVKALDLQPSQTAKLFKEASKGYEDLVHSTNTKWLAELPWSQYKAAMEQSLKVLNQ